MNPEPQQSDLEKLEVLRNLAKEAFDEVDRGNYITLEPDEIDAYLHDAAERAKAKAKKQ